MFSKFFIDRPVFAAVISILIVLGGAVTLFQLPIAQYPDIVPPTVTVTAFYPGADPTVVSDSVATPIEQQVNGVQGMLYMSSTCNKDGSYNLTVTFELGTNIDIAQVLVQNRVNLALPRLPPDVTRQGIAVDKKSVNFVTIYNVFSPKGTRDSLYLANYATLHFKDPLSRVNGVGSVAIFPANNDYSMRVWLDPGKLNARGLTTTDVITALQEQNVQVAAGQIGQPPVPAGQHQSFQLTVTTLGRLKDVSQFEDIILKTAQGNRVTRLRDVARAELGGQTYDTVSLTNGAPSCTILVYQLPGSNALQVARDVNAAMATLKNDVGGDDVNAKLIYDVSNFVNASIKEVVKTLVEAFLLVALVVFIFLQNWRATLIPVITIPVALVGTFIVMALLGFSINMLTLFGLVLAIGIVVDDAIVVVENVERVMEQQKLPPREAAVKSMNEVTGPIVGITLVLMSVFIPTAFLPGITGQMFKQFALTIAVTTLFSALNALTLSPALCALILKPRHAKPNPFFRGFNWLFDRTARGYNRLVRGALRFSVVSLLLYAGLVAVAFYGFTKLPTGFIPTEDQGFCFMNVQLPEAASAERTKAVVQQARDALKDVPGISSVTFITGFSLLDGTYSSNVAFGYFNLEPWDQRYAKQNVKNQNLDAILAHAYAKLSALPDAVAFAFPPPAILGLGNAGGFQMQVLDKNSLGLQVLESSARDLANAGNSQSRLRNVNTRFTATSPQLFADVDRVKTKLLNVRLQSVFDTMQAFLGSAYVNDLNKFGRVYQVRVQAESPYRMKPDDINQLYVRNIAGQAVPLNTLVKMKPSLGPPYIVRYNLYPTATINGEPKPGVSTGQALALMEQAAAKVLPPGIGYEWTGLSYQEKKVGNQAVIVLTLAVVIVFLVLAAQYESWTNPFAVILAVPMALLGAVAAVYIRHMDVNIYTQIGLVLLVALAAKNAILIVEFAREARATGLPLREAALAGARLRFRPILMTSFAFNLGVFPLVVATGAGAAGRVSLGTAVFGGMIAATLFPIVFVPVLWQTFQSLSDWRDRKAKPVEVPLPRPEPISANGPL